MRDRFRKSEIGAAAVEAALAMALVALLALPALSRVGKGVNYTVCMYAWGDSGQETGPGTIADYAFNWDVGTYCLRRHGGLEFNQLQNIYYFK